MVQNVPGPKQFDCAMCSLVAPTKNKKAIDGNCVGETLVVLIQIEATAFFLCRRNPAGFHTESNPYI